MIISLVAIKNIQAILKCTSRSILRVVNQFAGLKPEFRSLVIISAEGFPFHGLQGGQIFMRCFEQIDIEPATIFIRYSLNSTKEFT